MDAFGISCATLCAIKEGRYTAISGIELSDLQKISIRFNQHEKKLEKMMEAL